MANADVESKRPARGGGIGPRLTGYVPLQLLQL